MFLFICFVPQITENNEDCLNANKISEDGLQATLERGVSACSKKSSETCNNGDNVEDSAEDYTSDENKTNQKGKKMKSDTKKSENRTVTKNFRSFDNNEQSETDKNNSEDGNKSATKINKNAERELLEETTDESNGTKTKFKNHSSPIARILPEPPVLSSVKEECDDITIDLTSTVTERKRRLSDEHKSSDRNKISSTPAVVSTEKRQHLMDEHKSDRNKITEDEQRKTNIRVMSLKRDKHKTKHKMNSSSVVKDKQQELELNRVNPQQNEETIEEQPAVKENCWFRANLHSTNFIICNSCKTFLLDESAISKHKCQFETVCIFFY